MNISKQLSKMITPYLKHQNILINNMKKQEQKLKLLENQLNVFLKYHQDMNIEFLNYKKLKLFLNILKLNYHKRNQLYIRNIWKIIVEHYPVLILRFTLKGNLKLLLFNKLSMKLHQLGTNTSDYLKVLKQRIIN